MPRRALAVVVCLILVWSVGCGPGVRPPQARAAVKGSVTLDGKPLPDGEITFRVAGEAGIPTAVKDGSFAGEALVGKNQVEISAFKAGPPLSTDLEKKPTKVNIVLPKYNAQTTLEANVTAGGPNDFTFAVTSR